MLLHIALFQNCSPSHCDGVSADCPSNRHAVPRDSPVAVDPALRSPIRSLRAGPRGRTQEIEGYHGKGLKEKSLYRANTEATFLAHTPQEKTDPKNSAAGATKLSNWDRGYAPGLSRGFGRAECRSLVCDWISQEATKCRQQIDFTWPSQQAQRGIDSGMDCRADEVMTDRLFCSGRRISWFRWEAFRGAQSPREDMDWYRLNRTLMDSS